MDLAEIKARLLQRWAFSAQAFEDMTALVAEVERLGAWKNARLLDSDDAPMAQLRGERDEARAEVARLTEQRDAARDRARSYAATADAARAKVERLRALLRALVDKLDLCKPYVDGAFINTYTIRGGDYKGPNYGEELKQARAALEPLGDE